MAAKQWDIPNVGEISYILQICTRLDLVVLINVKSIYLCVAKNGYMYKNNSFADGGISKQVVI